MTFPAIDRSPPLRVSAAGEARIGPLLALPRILQEMGVSPGGVLREAGLPPGLFDNPENRIAYTALVPLLRSCATLTGRGDIGLLAGARFTLADFGLLGELMRNAATVGEALRTLLLHLHFYDRGAVPVLLRVEAQSVFLGYSLQQAALAGAQQLQDAAIAVAHRILRGLCGADWRPLSVQFAHRRPDDIGSYRRVFGPGVRFEAGLSGLSFDASCLEQRIAGADPARHMLLNRELRQVEARWPISMAEEVQCVLHQLLAGGTSSSTAVARLFGISQRTLRQKLQAEGTSMQRLLAQTRFELARHLLQDTRLPMSGVAEALCYADAAVFSRAFHGWSGMSPRAWRAGRAASRA